MEEWKRRDSFDGKVTCKLLSRSSTAPGSARSIRRTALLHLYWQLASLVIAMRFNFGWSHSSNSPELSVSSKDHISVCLLLTHMHTQAAPPPTHTHSYTSPQILIYLLELITFPKSMIFVHMISFHPVLCLILMSGKEKKVVYSSLPRWLLDRF